jgi:hypothetical protein
MDSNFDSEIINEKGTKLDVVLEVIFDEAYYGGCALYVLKKNSRIDEVKVDVLRL